MSPSGSKNAADDAQVEWHSIDPGEEQPFVMEQREKIRHKSTHELKTHQLVVKVNGWEAVTPVTMDKVGVYFRQAEPVKNEPSNIFCEVPPARIVFDVNIEGSARKVVTVRSALLLHNRLSDDIEVKLDSTLPDSSGRGSVVRVPAGSKSAMPLKFVHSKMLVRPVGWSLDWCKHPITWEQVARGGYSENSSTTCDTLGGEADTYRFCVSVYRQPYPVDPDRRPGSPADTPRYYRQPGHIISITPPLRLENLLPMELTYTMRIGSAPAIRNSIKPGQVAPLIMADMRQAIEMTVELENFPNCQDLCIPGASYVGEYTLYMSDMNHRQLHLRVKLRQGLGGSVKLSIFAYFWLINKSGVPIIFKQDGGGYNDVAAGQFAEHELARSVTPLLFAFTDKERPSIIAMRLGESVHGARNHTEFCTKFQLERGITYRALAVKPHEGGPSWVYNIGIEARQGRGRYRDTMLVTFAPRYTIDNRSSHKLGFAQKHTANRWQSSRPGEYASVMPKSTMTYHWVRVDLDNLLCVRLIDDQFCQWSGGFRIDRIQSQHINMRAEKNKCIFLRVDVVMQGSTFFAVFSDAEHMPPPYRVDNFAEVPIQYFQTRISDEKLRTHVKPRTSVPYAWDEPTLPPHITLRVPGGSSATYDMNVIADGEQLCYENFIYISFIGTFQGANGHPGNQRHWSGYDSYISEQRLVLDVVGPNKVILKKKETGKRSQLWRMTSTGMLQHEGSSVPRDPRKPHGSSVTFVLDISDLAHQPTRDVHLTLRKPDDRRKMTQTWRFTEDGRLCCGTGPNSNLCVQAKDGFFGLRDGGDAVLGPSPPNLRSRTDVPIEMAVYRQKMQPGSGFLSVKVLADGPTRVLQITDIRQQQYRDDDNDDWCLVSERRAKPIISASQDKSGEEQAKPHNSWEMSLHLPAGIGVSVVNDQSEELIYISLKDIIVDFQSTSAGQIFTASVKNVQIDNQIFGTIRPVLLYVTPKSRKDSDGDRKPALQISGHKVPSSKWNADIYKYLMVAMKRLTIQIEEVVLWKFLEFAGFNQQEEDVENLDENSFDTQRALAAATSNRFKRYYFGALKISTNRVTLSMYTASELPKHLKSVKQAMGIPLVKFEEAKVELDPYVELHPFETKAFLTESIKVHYTEELKSQAAKILGSVDFLGNPLGLFHDVAEGVSGLLEGNVSGLLKNVTHGVSDSAAKVTGSLSDGVSSVTLDRNHERQRRQIREHTGSSSDHLVAGFKGLTHGFVGGLTGIFSQTYSGARNEGIEGLFTGFAKGAVGVVTKPVAGVLDFASGAASAVRDTSKTSARIQPNRVRLPRCCYGQGEVLPPYSDQHAEAQEFLYHCNHHAYKEKYISSEKVMLSKHAVLALVTNRKVYFLPSKDKSNCDPLMECDYLSLVTARVVSLEGQSYIELTKKQNSSRSSSGPEPTSKPKIRCDSEVIAQKVCQQILYAKSLFEEQIQTLPLDLHHHGD